MQTGKLEHELTKKLPAASTPTVNLDNPAIKLAGLSALSILMLVSRIPFTSKILYHWDSVNFALAISEFNLVKEQPQPPGYILYVMLCRLVNSFVNDPQATMVAISVAASIGAVVAIYFLGEAMYNPKVGWLSAGFMASSPLFWFYNEIALPHTVDAFLVILGVFLLYKTMRGDRRYLIPAVVLFAVAGGVRQQTLVFLAPLILFSIRKVGWKWFFAAGAVGGIVSFAWFIPLITLSGGLESYLQVMGNFSDRFQSTTSIFMGAGFRGFTRNAIKLILYSVFGWGIVLLPAAYFAFRQIQTKRESRSGERPLFLVLWILPAIMYYLLVHMGQQGLIFVFLPALILLGAAGVDAAFYQRTSLLWVSGLVLILANSGIFLLLPEYPFGVGQQRMLTRQTLANSDKYYEERFETIRSDYSPDSTLILASSWHHADFYLPEYKVLPFNIGSKWEVDEGAPINNYSNIMSGTPTDYGLAAGDASLLVFDPELFMFASSTNLLEFLNLPTQGSMGVMEFQAQSILSVNADSYGLTEK
jgi:hypothetical protein